MNDAPVVDLHHALRLVDELESSIETAPKSHFEFTAPVLDRQGQKWVSEGARGINKFAENVALLRARVELVRLLPTPLAASRSISRVERC